MSLNSSTTVEREAASAGLGLAPPPVPRLAPGPGGYAAWRPQMENALMRAGVALRDYSHSNADWQALVAAVDRWAVEDERASIAFALGRGEAPAASSKGGPTAAEKEARRTATEAVARGKRAYALLYQALPGELRSLVAHVPQGDAYGLWSWLERRFQSTEQDHVGDLWDQFTALHQEDNETFDEYKARVDHVYGLLAHAKDKPSAGLYAHRLLWKLSPSYHAAVLALKASGKLKEADKIQWDDIVAFVNGHERSQQRLSGVDGEAAAMAAAAGPRAAAHRAGARSGAVEKRECFNCGKVGHLSRNCREPRRPRRDDDTKGDGEELRDGGGQAAEPPGGGARASMFIALSSDDEEDEQEKQQPQGTR